MNGFIFNCSWNKCSSHIYRVSGNSQIFQGQNFHHIYIYIFVRPHIQTQIVILHRLFSPKLTLSDPSSGLVTFKNRMMIGDIGGCRGWIFSREWKVGDIWYYIQKTSRFDQWEGVSVDISPLYIIRTFNRRLESLNLAMLSNECGKNIYLILTQFSYTKSTNNTFGNLYNSGILG